MFDKERYLSRGVQENLSIPVQITLWRMIEKVTVEKDYLQIFELSQLPNNQLRILHKQELPEYTSELSTNGNLPKEKLKIYVIDDGEYSTMLLADEY